LFKAAYYSQCSRVFAEYFFSDMSHRPSKVNKAHKHCHGLSNRTQAKKHNPINAHMHHYGLLNNPSQETNRRSSKQHYPH
jgi:hypothetical protein